MMPKSILFLFCFFLFTVTFNGQNLKKHQWENRVLLIISSQKDSKKVTQQIQLLKDKYQDLLERKLVIYTVHKEFYKFNFQSTKIEANKTYENFNKDKSPFKVLLLGLDGGIKLTQKEVLSTEKLFTLIDGMPMRQYELENKQ
jgi:hypothetical protein